MAKTPKKTAKKTAKKTTKSAADQPVAVEIRGSRDQSIAIPAKVKKEILEHVAKIRELMTNENLAAIMLSSAETLKNYP